MGFSHFEEVAKLSPEKQSQFLNKASEEKLSVRELRDEVRKSEIQKIPAEIPAGEYTVIYADPPWRYDFSETQAREIENQYPTMDIEEIKTMKIPAHEDSVLFLWATAPKLREALEVMEAWGFEYKTIMMMKILTEEGVEFCNKVIGVRFLKGGISL